MQDEQDITVEELSQEIARKGSYKIRERIFKKPLCKLKRTLSWLLKNSFSNFRARFADFLTQLSCLSCYPVLFFLKLTPLTKESRIL